MKKIKNEGMTNFERGMLLLCAIFIALGFLTNNSYVGWVCLFMALLSLMVFTRSLDKEQRKAGKHKRENEGE